MKTVRTYLILFLVVAIGEMRAQQTPSYTQFVMNQFAFNPAVAGTNIGLEMTAGTRLQWIGMPNSPTTNFASVTFGWRKDFSYRGHHGVGFYSEDDRQGMFSSKSAYICYAYHLRIFTGWNIGAGIFAGVRRMGLNQLLYDAADPALNFSKNYGYLYPDVIPGIRVYSRKLFFDISVRQAYVNKIRQGSFHVGTSGSTLDPTVIFSVKRRFFLGSSDWSIVPAAMVQYAVKNVPYVQANLMAFYHRRVGVGASVRGTSFASAILQIRILKNVLAGISYDYSINRFRTASANSLEMVLQLTPGDPDSEPGKRRFKVAQCPDFDF